MARKSNRSVSLRELLNLPAVERYRLADRLYSSLSEEEQDDALEAELDRRWKEVVSGKVQPLPRSALKKMPAKS